MGPRAVSALPRHQCITVLQCHGAVKHSRADVCPMRLCVTSIVLEEETHFPEREFVLLSVCFPHSSALGWGIDRAPPKSDFELRTVFGVGLCTKLYSPQPVRFRIEANRHSQNYPQLPISPISMAMLPYAACPAPLPAVVLPSIAPRLLASCAARMPCTLQRAVPSCSSAGIRSPHMPVARLSTVAPLNGWHRRRHTATITLPRVAHKFNQPAILVHHPLSTPACSHRPLVRTFFGSSAREQPVDPANVIPVLHELQALLGPKSQFTFPRVVRTNARVFNPPCSGFGFCSLCCCCQIGCVGGQQCLACVCLGGDWQPKFWQEFSA